MKRFAPQEIEKSLRNLVSWSVRFLIYGGAGGGTLERYYAERAKSIWKGTIQTANALADDMMNVLPSDTQFAEAFASARISRAHLARYYLRAMEIKKAGGDPCLIPNPDTDAVSVEHVLPENPDPSWNVKPEIAEAFYRRIGNMVLLSTPINNDRDVGNKKFSVKQPFYASAPFELTKAVALFQDWGPDQIAERQEGLAKLAVKTWPPKS
jgi:hypothetical protein